MPAAISTERSTTGITKLTNCLLVRGDSLVSDDLWISSHTGRILPAQEVFYGHQLAPDEVVDLGGRIVSPGFIDVQFNGAYGFDFSIPSDPTIYHNGVRELNKKLVVTGLTSYLPTVITSKPEVYHQVLPFLGPSGGSRDAANGAESLGAHVEGPFMSPTKRGVHNASILRAASEGFLSLERCYGASNLAASSSPATPTTVKMITSAPEVEGIMESIPELVDRGIIFSIGHTEASYEQGAQAVQKGARMVTHLFNAMKPLHHRDPGLFGLLGRNHGATRPYFGLIADGIHLHPTTVKIAWTAHPEGMILVTDALALMGLEDGVHEWTNSDRILKKGPYLTKEGTDTIAGGAASLLQCLNNFLSWSGAPIPTGIAAVTSTPAKMLNLYPRKGTLEAEADADLCILDEIQTGDETETEAAKMKLKVHQVWKFGRKIFDEQWQ